MSRSPAHPSGSVPVVHLMVVLVVVMAIAAALAGLFWPGGNGAYTITSYRGQDVEIFGEGVYRDSSTFSGAGARGTDLVTLLIVVPLLIASLVKHRRGSVPGTILLAGSLVWMVYVYSSMALGTTAYNNLFLLYVAIVGTATWSLVFLLARVDLLAFATALNPGISRTLPGNFLVSAGAVTAIIWLLEPVGALLSDEYPELLGVSTTLFTHGFDMAVIAPAAIVSGLLIRRGSPLGYLGGLPMLLLLALLTPAIVAQTVLQMRSGVEFAPAQVAIMIGGFLVMGILAIVIVRRVLRDVHVPAG